jgi:RecA-family ATPase
MLHRPALLILDPLIRIHMADENASGDIAALLGYLRTLQRKWGTAIALVHL